MYGYIYKTTNLINNKIYIGQHKCSVFEPDVYIGSGTLLRRAIDKYGVQNFKNELLCECFSQEELDEKEIFWIDKLNSTDLKIGYNITIGGQGGAGPRTEETKEKIRLANTGKTLVNDGMICFRIDQSELQEFLSLGYSYGPLPYNRTEEFKDKVKTSLTGRIGVRKGDIKTKIKPDELEKYLSEGYEVGWYDKKPIQEYVSKRVPGEGKCKFMHKDNVYVLVPESRQLEYQTNGWEFGAKGGRKKFVHKKGYKPSAETIRKLSESHKGHKNSPESIEKGRLKRAETIKLYGAKSKGTIWINKDGNTKMIYPDQLDKFLLDGWKKGRK